MAISLVVDAGHEALTKLVARARVSVWISTANLKSTLVEAPVGTRARARGKYISFFETLADLVKRGVEVRVLHAGEPSRPLAKDLARLSPVPMRRCPRVHLKMIAVDGSSLYLGSANLTGAGIGAKGEGRRNFELGILTDDTSMLDATQGRFDRIWRGAECKACALRRVCPKPIDMLLAKPKVRARPKPRGLDARKSTRIPDSGSEAESGAQNDGTMMARPNVRHRSREAKLTADETPK